jgi:xanthine/CO dehydrogenase XdhC/CoxF family maturation factor
MAYRRGSRKTWSFQARTARGWKQLSTGATDKTLAGRIEAMWERLAAEFRAWDLLDPVLNGRQDIRALFDLWERTGHNPHEVRRLLADADLEPLVTDWHTVYSRKHPDTDSPAHALVHVRALLPEG